MAPIIVSKKKQRVLAELSSGTCCCVVRSDSYKNDNGTLSDPARSERRKREANDGNEEWNDEA